MLEIMVGVLWGCFTVYALWYFTSAKHYAPITSRDAKLLWRIHKHDFGCNSRRWREIKRKGHTVGFECECGFRHIQKRPIVTKMPVPNIKFENSSLSTLEKMHTSYKST